MKNERKTLKTPFECNVPLTTLKKKKQEKKIIKNYLRCLKETIISNMGHN